ncbi:MAG: hypothetical protein KGZ88_15285, partial [Methylomicrobium sp.]|nr:hypothetical protein [Methylomicrobium sp.]
MGEPIGSLIQGVNIGWGVGFCRITGRDGVDRGTGGANIAYFWQAVFGFAGRQWLHGSGLR